MADRYQIQRHRRRFFAEAHQPRDAVGRVHGAPEPAGDIESYENVTGKQGAHGGNELAVPLPRFLFHWQEGVEALALEVLIRDAGAVRLQLRQKPACAAIVESHFVTQLI